MIKIVPLRILVALAITISSSSAANAGFLSPGSDSYFAASNWMLTTNGGDGSGTITSDAMTLISNDDHLFNPNKYVRYSILIPANAKTLSFSYSYSTNDTYQYYDIPSYIIGSDEIIICIASDISCSGTVTNLDLSSLAGQQFIFQQISDDGIGGQATLVITEIYGVITAPPAPAPKPVETYVRKSTNLQFNEAMYGSDKLSDPDGQLRKTVDAIDAKYGYLIK